MNLEFHPVANIFPLLQGEEFEALKRDIQENGLIEPIWIHPDGRIIDGRNRYRACEETGTEPKFKIWSGKGSLVSFALSLNLHRRHLDSSQRAAIAAEILPMLEEEAKERQRESARRNQPQNHQIFDDSESFRQPQASEQAAQLLHTNRQYVSDAKKIKAESPELFEQVKAGEVKIPEAKRKLSQPMQVFLSHKDVEYYTPVEYIEAAREVMGGIDLDPASCEEANQTVKAETFYTQEQDGLTLPWSGRVWINPPYSKRDGKSNQEIWANRIISEYESGNIQEGILLVKSALGYNWFENIWDRLPVCLVRQRLSFTKSDGTDDGQSKHGTAIFYVGKNLQRFIDVYLRFGRITTPDGRYITNETK